MANSISNPSAVGYGSTSRHLRTTPTASPKAATGLDGRRIRKEIFVAIGSDVETTKDPNKLTTAKIEAAFRQSLKTQKEMAQ